MFFKSARIFRLTKPLQHTAESLHELLTEQMFVPCDSYQPTSLGWIEPMGKHGSLLSHQTNGNLMLCACKEERLLPATVLREAVEQEVELIETEQARRVFPSEKRRIKEDALQRMLPKAFTKKRLVYGYLDLTNQWLVVDSTSPKVAEEFTQLLRQSLGSLPIVPLITNQEPASVMSHWLLKQSLPSDYITGEDCVLRDQSDSKVALRAKGIDFDSPDFKVYLEGGMRVVKMSLQWQKQIDFNLGDDFGISRIRMNDILSEGNENIDSDDFAGRFDADFALMAGSFAELFGHLIEGFGGIDESIE